jgi:lysophospholipase L1-like esterase
VHRPRLPLLATAIAGTVTLLLALAPSASAAGVNYVALGDSYSSGVGSGSYTSSSGDCLRSSLAYSQLWANAHAPSSYASVACSGATTTDVIDNQVSALSAATSLVSISIGGNDLNFAGVMQDCVLYSTSTCVSELNTAEATARSSLPGWLDGAYDAISAHAPNAEVVVMDYPRFYHDLWYCVGLSSTDRNKINEAADVLDGVISSAAARHGFRFGDVRSAFAGGHEICDGSSSWLHSVNLSDLTESYHPTASGQSGGYLPAFTSAAG